jgi:hypothetical protein
MFLPFRIQAFASTPRRGEGKSIIDVFSQNQRFPPV